MLPVLQNKKLPNFFNKNIAVQLSECHKALSLTLILHRVFEGAESISTEMTKLSFEKNHTLRTSQI